MEADVSEPVPAAPEGRGGSWAAAGWVAFGMAWVLSLGVGFFLLWSYKLRAGEREGTPAAWPSESTLSRPADRARLLLFAHPHCACTRASLAELARLLARYGQTVETTVVFPRPAGAGADWDGSDLWPRAAAIPGVVAVLDEGGVEAARFGIRTSGATVLYDRRGRLQFSGGITPARGHEGDGPGLRRLRSWLTTGRADGKEAPVFGCALPLESRTEASR